MIQKMIEYVEQNQKEKIIKKIIFKESLEDNYSKHLFSYIEKMGYNLNNGQKKPIPEKNKNKEENKNSNMNINDNNLEINNMTNDLNNNNMNNYEFNNKDLNLNQMEGMNNMNFNNFMGNYPDDSDEFQNNKDNNDL